MGDTKLAPQLKKNSARLLSGKWHKLCFLRQPEIALFTLRGLEPVMDTILQNMLADLHEKNKPLGVAQNTKQSQEEPATETMIQDLADQIQGLQHQLKQLQEENSKLKFFQEIAFHDWLTDLPNRRYFEKRFKEELARSHRNNTSLSIAVIDLDNLKTINDDAGHDAGDQALKFIAKFLKEHLRITDIFCRYGGDEFVVIMPETRKDLAIKAINRVQKMLDSNKQLATIAGDHLVSFSFGVADKHSAGREDKLLQAADEAMYKDKYHRKSAA